MNDGTLIAWLNDLGSDDVAQVGGKNASLGEMIRHLGTQGVRVPGGFATTAQAYRQFLADNALEPRIRELTQAFEQDERPLSEVGEQIRALFLDAEIPAALADAVRHAYQALAEQTGRDEPDVAVRSSATAEDLPEASFAGQQETFLNIRGTDALLDAIRRCFASLFTDRAISYRQDNGFDQLQVALSVGVQRMVRSDSGSSGVMFSIDTDTGFPRAVLINGAWGLGETVVQGIVDPDEYLVFKPLLGDTSLRPIIARQPGGKAQKMVYADTSAEDPTRLVETSEDERRALVLSDDEVLSLARWAVTIEDHYGKPMDMEWAKDGETGELFIVQARPETVHSQRTEGLLKTYRLKASRDETGEPLVSGTAIGDAIAAGKVFRLDDPGEDERFEDGGVLVTEMTDPDWVPIMRRAAAIVTDHGGRTSHAAIVSRELGLPAIVGTGHGTERLADGDEVTVSCASGETGRVYAGRIPFEAEEISLDEIPKTGAKIMLNMANPAAALRWWQLPSDGVGLARMEFIVNQHIKIHPMALIHPDAVDDEDASTQIAALTAGWDDPQAYFVDHLARGIARIAAGSHPHPVIVRMSDFKTNEYADLIGGRAFEPVEANPMLGWRGASRYYSDAYREGFALECRAIRKAREEIGFDNILVMIPFCRTPLEADRVLEVMAEEGLKRGEQGLEVYVMCEIPANVILARDFAARFDGFSIGSNDLTQLVLGVDRDSDRLAHLFDERNDAVRQMISSVITDAHERERKVGLCGQAPSDHPDFAAFLVRAGIDSISVNPDSFLSVKQAVAEIEQAG
ncbi:phosphoenolpyruvate synthase [Lamprobacter modestohalophilus]|uniref:phosphoenolpyruvate synthase n=1 Tax=Lamprobacter modestohalophilus TaxID=1064514 RepID=UPI002ADEED79|nr:phosphoenolpyruvate synthase [Lamprobacter modestohalophilus]MEA1053183.1 phosphoenolpyruvate synthase [Lamprobacter modestohalophilus]